MSSFNQVILMGNLTRDVQLKYLPSQTAVAEFGLACNRKFTTAQGEAREEVLFVDCTAFGKTGELIAQYFTKGKPIFIEGRLKYDQWEDKTSGGKRSKLTVVVNNFQFIGGRDGAGQGGGEHDQSGTTDAEDNQAEARRVPIRDKFKKQGPADPMQRLESPISEEAVFDEASIPF